MQNDKSKFKTSLSFPPPVIPAKAGIHGTITIDSRLRGNDKKKDGNDKKERRNYSEYLTQAY